MHSSEQHKQDAAFDFFVPKYLGGGRVDERLIQTRSRSHALNILPLLGREGFQNRGFVIVLLATRQCRLVRNKGDANSQEAEPVIKFSFSELPCGTNHSVSSHLATSRNPLDLFTSCCQSRWFRLNNDCTRKLALISSHGLFDVVISDNYVDRSRHRSRRDFCCVLLQSNTLPVNEGRLFRDKRPLLLLLAPRAAWRLRVLELLLNVVYFGTTGSTRKRRHEQLWSNLGRPCNSPGESNQLAHLSAPHIPKSGHAGQLVDGNPKRSLLSRWEDGELLNMLLHKSVRRFLQVGLNSVELGHQDFCQVVVELLDMRKLHIYRANVQLFHGAQLPHIDGHRLRISTLSILAACRALLHITVQKIKEQSPSFLGELISLSVNLDLRASFFHYCSSYRKAP
mmetsp:Transcript_44302/g.172399  ORF Transcript_44302/g.172399 Transcript_44302/m.172399 type:complete len:396 (-) Transcript_44302:184-1371(-)